jgi:hypothetical protein
MVTNGHAQRMNRAMRLCRLGPLVIALLVQGCAGGKIQRATAMADLPPQPYVRVGQLSSNQVQLEIAAREFLPARRGQPVIWLTGVSHIGDTNYYAALQKHLDKQTLVLFEGVGAAEANAAGPSKFEAKNSSPASPAVMESSDSRGSLQSAMAASLGLVFQLQAIDYRRTNFLNSDLSVSQLRDLMNEQQSGSDQPAGSASFDNLLQLMEGGSWFDTLLQAALRLLGSNPKFQALGRLALIDLLGQIQGDPSHLQGLPPEMKQLLEVLLQRRNEKVISDLKARLPQLKRHGSIAVFFGTGHMPDLETQLRKNLHYLPAREVWFTAFGVDLEASRITKSERDFIDNLVKWQLNAAKSSAGP